MSGFESAIRNAISRAPDGRPQTRQRIYDAARSSLERNLARVEMADADARRTTLELTIERIEEEWRAITMRRDVPPPSSPPPDAERLPDPATVPVDALPLDAVPNGRPELVAEGSGVQPTPRSAPLAEPQLASPASTHELVEVAEPASPAATPAMTRTALDPTLAEQLAARDDLMGVGAAAPEPSAPATADPLVSPSSPATSEVERDADAASLRDEPGEGPVTAASVATVPAPGGPAIPDAGTEAVPDVGPAVEAPAAAPGRRGSPDRKKPKRARTKPVGKTEKAGKAKPRGRWVSRVASLALLVGVAALGWQWLDDAGMLEEGEPERVVVTIERGGSPGGTTGQGAEWTALLTRELSGAVEPVEGEDALRVTGPAEIALDAEALAGLGPEISVSLLLRAVGEPGQAAVSCAFTGGGCGRLRFTLPREAEERVVNATIAGDDEARLVLDPGVGGETAAFDLLGVTARSR